VAAAAPATNVHPPLGADSSPPEALSACSGSRFV
jgi:hypothetical protein